MKTLKDKKLEKNFIKLYPNQFKDYSFFKYTDVKEAVLKSYKNNEICINKIIMLIEDIELTDKQRFFIMMVLDGIKINNKEAFGNFEE